MIVKSAKEIISFQLNPLATKTLKRVQGDMFVILNLFQELIILKSLLNIVETDSSPFGSEWQKIQSYWGFSRSIFPLSHAPACKFFFSLIWYRCFGRCPQNDKYYVILSLAKYLFCKAHQWLFSVTSLVFRLQKDKNC